MRRLAFSVLVTSLLWLQVALTLAPIPLRRVAAQLFVSAGCTATQVQTAITAATGAGNGNIVAVPGGCTVTPTSPFTSPIGTSFRLVGGYGGGTTTFHKTIAIGDYIGVFYADDPVWPLEISRINLTFEAGDHGDGTYGFRIVTTVAGGRHRVHHTNCTGPQSRCYFHTGLGGSAGVFATGLYDYNVYTSRGPGETKGGVMQALAGQSCASGTQESLDTIGQYTIQDDLMALDYTPGGETGFVYSENDTYNYLRSQDGGFEPYGCDQAVVRFNAMHGVNQGMHGNEGQRSIKWWEYYHNIMDTATFISSLVGAQIGDFIIGSTNNQFRVNWTGQGAQTVTLDTGTWSGAAIAQQLDDKFAALGITGVDNFGTADNRVNLYAVGGSFSIGNVSNSAYATLGFSTGTKGEGYGGRIHHLRNGNGFVFNNTYTALMLTGIQVDIYRVEDRWPFGSAPAGGYCKKTTPGSVADGNTGISGSSVYPGFGYPCWDQTGYKWNQWANAMRVYTPWPSYIWNNLKAGVELPAFANPNDGVNWFVQDGVDFMNRNTACDTPGGSCTAGVGMAPIASRPTSCTTGAGFWATDEGNWRRIVDMNGGAHAGADGRFYKCTATNTWTLLYTPLTYPHPKASYKVAFTDQPPASITTGGSLGTVAVTVQYIDGVTYPEDETVFMTASGCLLDGTTAVQAVDGVATFSDLTLTGLGECYLTARVWGLETDDSSMVDVEANPPSVNSPSRVRLRVR